MQLLPGFRDFYPEDCALRNYVLSVWRSVAAHYGFVEYDGPVLEPIELYRKKSGGELVGQLFDFVDKGERHVSLRPEMTPTLARMVASRERDYKKPLKWFCAPSFFRYEKQQRGRLREFFQLNCDILGDGSPAADAELLALLIDILRGFGLGPEDFVVRLSDRDAWLQFAQGKGVTVERLGDFLAVVDKLERSQEADNRRKLAEFGIELDAVRAFIAEPSGEAAKLQGIIADLTARGLEKYVTLDLTGGRYDGLLELMSDGKVKMPALGFGMGDVVLANLISEVPHAKAKRDAWLAANRAAEVYVVVADEEHRTEALGVVQLLREGGWRTDFALSAAKVGKQFQAAEAQGAQFAVVVGAEWPELKIKALATRTEHSAAPEQLVSQLRSLCVTQPSA
ncbi:MAG: histidine--tRNA ligase [Proteobacteria bacterium]|nr:histidine--tRNA ligase [Pseudomonadota bacterium]